MVGAPRKLKTPPFRALPKQGAKERGTRNSRVKGSALIFSGLQVQPAPLFPAIESGCCCSRDGDCGSMSAMTMRRALAALVGLVFFAMSLPAAACDLSCLFHVKQNSRCEFAANAAGDSKGAS